MGAIRLFLALSVVAGHAGSLFGYELFDSAAAVQLFYVISGFYMALVLDTTYRNTPVRRFYLARYMRLAPTYWVVMLATLGASLVFHRTIELSADRLGPLLHSLKWSTIIVLVVVNIVVLGQDLVMLLAINPDGGLYVTSTALSAPSPAYTLLLVPQAWSLGVELLFYLVAPYLLRGRTWVIVVVAAASVVLRAMLMSKGYTYDPWTYRVFPTEIAVFLLGALAYRAYRSNIGIASKNGALAILGGMFGIFFVYSLVPSSIPEPLKRFTAVALLALALPSLFALTRKWKLDNSIGKLSFPIYISHLLLLGFVRNTGKWRAPLLIVISTGAAMVLVRFLEDPIDRWRTKLRGSSAA